jgi:hypothetical protein
MTENKRIKPSQSNLTKSNQKDTTHMTKAGTTPTKPKKQQTKHRETNKSKQ